MTAGMPGERPLRPINSHRLGTSPPGEPFTFVAMGDTRPASPGMPFPRVTQTIVREIALLRPAFVVFTGDSIWGYQDTRQEMLNELDRFRALADRTGVPLFNAPGNHEMQTAPEAVELLRERGHDLYGSFDYGGYHFVALNTDEVLLEGRVTGPQLEWLEQDLATSDGAGGIFVFMHRPLHSWFAGDFNEDDAEHLCRLFERYGVGAAFAAHNHFYYEETHAGVRYMTIGGGGSPMYTQPHAGGFSHYVVVSVESGAVRYDVIEPGHLEVAYPAGNDGFEVLTIARVANTTDRDLRARNLELRVPRLSDPRLYRISTHCEDFAREPYDIPATLRAVRDLGDGSVTLSVEVPMPTGMAFRVTVEASEPR